MTAISISEKKTQTNHRKSYNMPQRQIRHPQTLRKDE